MAGNIKGITIEFRGNTTPLEEAIRKVNSEISSTDKELRKVNNALKFNPNSVDLWKQKQELLTQKINQTKEKLDVLKDTQKKVDSGEIEMTADEYRNLRREIIETDSKLKNFESQLRKIGNVKLKVLSQQLKQVGDKLSSIGKTMTTKVTAPIVAGYTLASKYASDYEENLNKLDVAFGDNSESVKEWAKTARQEFGLSQVQATSAASAFGALGKGIGLSEKDAAEMSTTLAGLSADLGSYFNVGTDESAKALEGIFTGESEALKKFGVVMTDTNLKQFAEDQGLVWEEMSQSEKTMLRYNYVLDKTKDAQGDFSRTSDGTANSIKIFKASIQDLATSIGTNLLPIITPIIQKITEWINKFNELSPRTQKIITIIGLVVAAAGPLLVIIGTLISSIGAIVGAIGLITAPMLGIVALIVAVGAIIAWFIKHWEELKAELGAFEKYLRNLLNSIDAKITQVWNSIKAYLLGVWKSIKSTAKSAWDRLRTDTSTAFNKIKTAIVKPIQNAIDTVKGIIDKIKGWFPIKIGKIFSNLKLPHFSLDWATKEFGKLGSIKYPTGLDVSWYKNGGIFDSPSIVGLAENGSEAVVPLDTLWKKLDNIANASANGAIVVNVYGSDNMSVNELAEAVQQKIIQMQKRRTMAWQ